MTSTSPYSPIEQPSPEHEQPSPSKTDSAEELPPDSSPDDPLVALLGDERAGERWVRLDVESLLRAADFRRIKQGSQTTSEQTIAGRRYQVQWPLPSLVINNDLELPYPQWTVEELLQVIGAEVIEPPRGPEQMEWIVGKQIT